MNRRSIADITLPTVVNVEVNYALGLLYRVDVGGIADVTEAHAASVFWTEKSKVHPSVSPTINIGLLISMHQGIVPFVVPSPNFVLNLEMSDCLHISYGFRASRITVGGVWAGVRSGPMATVDRKTSSHAAF
jgi:hypothetical protein